MSTPRATTNDSKSESRMGTTVRRGPRYRSPCTALSGSYQGSLNDRLAARMGVSPETIDRLRFRAPGELARMIGHMREMGEAQAAAPILAAIEGACAGMVADLDMALLAAADAEAACDSAEARYLLDRSTTNGRDLRRHLAREIAADTALYDRLGRSGD